MASKLKFGILILILSLFSSVSLTNNKLSTGQILQLVNEDRAKHALPQLSLDSTLNLAALAKAQDMLANNYFDHISPDGVKPWHFFKALGYQYIYAGENLALNYDNAEELVESWMESPKHRANILSPYYSDLGVAVVRQNNKTLIVQLFGSKDGKLTLNK